MTQVTNSGFQTLVNRQPAPGQAGDFYGVNPRAVVLSANVPAGASGAGGAAAQGALVAPPGGLIVGNFAWADLTTGVVSQSYNPNGQLGILHRDEQAVITTFLGVSTYILNAGFEATLFSQADLWALFAAGATPGQNVYADPRTGAPVAGGASAPNVASVTGSVGASFTGVIATNVLTASAVTGYLSPGDIINGTSVVNAVLGAQLTGTPGGAGTYTLVHADQTSEAMTSTSTVLDVTAVGSGVLGVGDKLTGPSGSPLITAQISSTETDSHLGGKGLYQLSGSPISFASGTITVAAIATPWKVKSKAGNGEVAKISTWGK